MATSNRERRAAKQRRRDQKRGRTDEPRATPDRGLSAEALRRVLTDTAADLAAGDPDALPELRHLLTEHLARRREHVLAACDEVLAEDVSAVEPAELPVVVTAHDLDAVLGPAGELATALATSLDAAGTVAGWADEHGVTAEIAAVATVGVRARRLVDATR